MLIFIVSLIVAIAFIITGFVLFIKYQISQIPKISFKDALEYTTKDNPDAVITVGIIKNGQATYKVYGENGKEIASQENIYEIGSLTKTFTATLINKAINEGKISIDSSIDKYLPLSKGNNYPTIKDLLTHTSGYKSFYFERCMVSNFFKRRNDFYGVTKEMVMAKLSKLNVKKKRYNFAYSNFGYAVLGLVLEAVYDTDYKTLLNSFVQNELGLTDTKISDKSGNLGKYWDWKSDDAYLSAGAITSNITDMLAYAQYQLNTVHKSLKVIDASSKNHKTMDINMDEIGTAWLFDNKNSVIWHNGGTGNYNSYLGFNTETKTAVVILSNLPPNYKIPATVLGIKLLKDEIRNNI